MGIELLAILSVILIGTAVAYPKPGACTAYSLQTLYQWSVLNFTSGTDGQNDYTYLTGATESGGRLFLSNPRGIEVTPPTLATVPTNRSMAGNFSPLLQPYPDIAWNQAPTDSLDCSWRLIAVHRTRVDSCNRLWVLDSGTLSIFGRTQRVCPPKIVIFDLATDSAVRTIVIPNSALTPVSVLVSLVIDDKLVSSAGAGSSGSGCDNVFAYVADFQTPAVIVMTPGGEFYRISSPFMHADPDDRNFQLNGERFTTFQAIVGMDVAGVGMNRSLYFQPLASREVFSIPTSTLQAGPFKRDDSQLPVRTRFTKTSGSAALTTDKYSGCLLYNPVSQTSISTWNPSLGLQRTVATSQSQILFVFDIAIDSNNLKQSYALSVNWPRYMNRNINPQEINMRILTLTNLM